MICLKSFDAQEVFDKAAKYLLTQKSICRLYRGIDNAKSVTGIFITDEDYKLEFEGKDWEELFSEEEVSDIYLDLMIELETASYVKGKNELVDELQELAFRHGVSSNIVDEYI